MNFDYSEEQQLLADSVRRYLARDYGFDARQRIVASEAGWDPKAWAAFAEMGLTALPLGAQHGGFGGGALDLMAVMEAFGESLVVEPFLATVVAARLCKGSNEADSLLASVAQGRSILAFAHAEKGARHRVDAVQVKARSDGSRWRLAGEKAAVVGAPMADHVVLSARAEGGIGVFLAETPRVPGFARLDGVRAADLVFDATPAARLEGGLAEIEAAIDFGTALVCAEAVGAMQYACEATLEYLKTRKQFGVPIGRFQALQHRVVDMFIALEQARSMACLACSKIDSSEGAKDRARAVSAAKIGIADAARHISQESVQLHGGMGMTEELKVSHTFRRLTLLAAEFGDADHYLARFATL